MDKIARFHLKPTPLAAAGFLCLALICLPMTLRVFSVGTLDADAWFLLATGREIWQNGIPYINPWSYTGGQQVVVQQWLHDAWLYGWYRLGGYVGVAVSPAVPAGLLAWQLLSLYRDLGSGRKLSLVEYSFCLAIAWISLSMYLSIRPTLWCALLLAATLRIMVRYRDDGSEQTLLPLIPLSILGVNLQAAQWPLLPFTVALFAAVELCDLVGGDADSRKHAVKRAASMVLAAACMCGAGLINPYGPDGTLYVFKSLGEAGYGGAIVEMQSPFHALGIIAFLPLGAFLLAPVALRKLSGSEHGRVSAPMLLDICACIAAAMSVRCVWIAGLACSAACAEALAGMDNGRLGPPAHRAFIPIVSAAIALAVAVSGAAVSGSGYTRGVCGNMGKIETDLAPISRELSHRGDDVRLLSTDVAAYNFLEWEGFKVPCDMRPEIWASGITGTNEASAYREIVDVLQGRKSVEDSIADCNWNMFLVRDDETQALETGARVHAIAKGGGYVLYEISE